MADFLVIGSAHLDIICEAVEFKETIDKPGRINIDFGGTAANVAVNLSEQGVSVDFVTATNSSAISSVILHEMKRPGIRVMSVLNDSLPESGFSAHLKDGEMHSAVASMAVQEHTFNISDDIRESALSSKWMILDCNLNIDSLKLFSTLASECNCKLAYLLVSEGKGTKVAKLPTADIYFCNHREYIYLQTHTHGWQQSDNSIFVVTNGVHGATAFNGAVKCNHTPAVDITATKNFMGAGDAFAAGVLYRLFCGDSLDVSMANGAGLARRVISNEHCNLGQFNSLNRQIQNLSTHAYQDNLTKLNNRAGADLVISEFKDSKTAFSVLVFDIDHFKKVNDTYGHKTGDVALVHVSQLIKRSIGDFDCAFRFGGEEFVVISPVNIGLARSMAERIRKHVEKFGAVGPVSKITVSVGVSYAESTDAFSDAFESADKALYNAKLNGRNQVCLYSPH